jgi:hypothetical protein
LEEEISALLASSKGFEFLLINFTNFNNSSCVQFSGFLLVSPTFDKEFEIVSIVTDNPESLFVNICSIFNFDLPCLW